jgi:hypothetical protein
MMIKRFTFCIVLFACAIPLAAQNLPGTDDPDFKEILAYRLTMPAVDRMVRAARNLTIAIANDPRFKRQQALEAEIENLRNKEEPTEADEARIAKLESDLEALEESTFSGDDTKTLSDMAAAFKKEPALAKAFADAGVEPREFFTFMLAYFQAGVVHGMMKSGLVNEVPKDMAASINMENIKFVAEHEKELEGFATEMQALKPSKQ